MGRPRKIKPDTLEGQSLVAKTQELDPDLVRGVEVIPSIEIAGHKNGFQALFEGDPAKIPTLKSVGYCQMPGTNTFVSYKILSKGGKILKIECEEPNLRPIAEESAKIAFVSTFMSGDDDVSL